MSFVGVCFEDIFLVILKYGCIRFFLEIIRCLKIGSK